MNFEFFIAQSIVILIALCAGFWTVSNRIAEQFVENKKDVDEKINKIQMALLNVKDEFSKDMEDCQKAIHENKGSVFARIDLIKLENERTYIRQDMANERFHNLEEKNNAQLTNAMTLLKQELGYVKDELVKLNKQMLNQQP